MGILFFIAKSSKSLLKPARDEAFGASGWKRADHGNSASFHPRRRLTEIGGRAQGKELWSGASPHGWQHSQRRGFRETVKETRGRDPPPAHLLHLPDKHTCLEACRFLGTLWATRVRSCCQGFAIVLCQPCTVSVFIFANMTQLKGNHICTFHIMSGKMNAVRRVILT